MTILYACRISGNCRGAVASCELDVAVGLQFYWMCLMLQLAVTIMASFCRQDGCRAARKVKMSLDFHWVRRGLEEGNGKVCGAQTRVCFWHGVWRGASCRPLHMNNTWTQRAAGKPVVHLPFARMAKAMEDDWWGSTVRNTVRNTAQISRVHRGDRCMQLCHVLLEVFWSNTVINSWLAWMDGHVPHASPYCKRNERKLFIPDNLAVRWNI